MNKIRYSSEALLENFNMQAHATLENEPAQSRQRRSITAHIDELNTVFEETQTALETYLNKKKSAVL